MAETSTFDKKKVQAFIDDWSQSKGAERSNAQHFLLELIDLLGADRPPKDVEASQDHCFEKALKVDHRNGHESTNFIDYYKRDHFVLEAKQGSESGDKAKGTAVRGTTGWDKAMRAAFGQARSYSAHLPEGRPPFLITVDVGFCFEVWSGFSGTYGSYGARDTYYLDDLAKPEVFDFFVKVFNDPQELNPYAKAARVTREVAEHLAELGKALEEVPYTAQEVAAFLMRCIFTMFAEDVGLLPSEVFTTAMRERWMKNPAVFAKEVERLWATMDVGGNFGFEKILKFNGGLFSSQQGIPLNAKQLKLLLEAAERDWAHVEPSIFGTLLERALDPEERHSLGAHFTPRAYIERLVRPTVIEPVREEWEAVQLQVWQLVEEAGEARAEIERANAELTDVVRKAVERGATTESRKKQTELDKAIKAGERVERERRRDATRALTQFHDQICGLRILDPACGTGNFLYVTFDLLKEVEEEVLRELGDLDGDQMAIEAERITVDPGQFLGIEKNPRAREIADLVLWIGYLQWYKRSRGDLHVPEPVLHAYKNIECRDAILAWDGEPVPRVDESGQPVVTWLDRPENYKRDPISGLRTPDLTKRSQVLDFEGASKALPWPSVDFIVGNPPFIGTKRMRAALGDGYVDALRDAWADEVESNADLVMYWWNRAAQQLSDSRLRRFGFITTNSISQTFNRRVLEGHLSGSVQLVWAIPDHPWVESASGADVRIAMTVAASVGSAKPRLLTLVSEGSDRDETGAAPVVLEARQGHAIHADLTMGADVAGAVGLKANELIAGMGMALHGAGFTLSPDELAELSLPSSALNVFPYVKGRDLLRGPVARFVIDFSGMSLEEARASNPSALQHLMTTVKPHRDQNRRASIRERWWRFGWERPRLREALQGLTRFIGTTETSKHRVFQFISGGVVPDHKILVVALGSGFALGVLSSTHHALWSDAAGGRLGVGNDPIYNKTKCFDPFPFPATDSAQAEKIGSIAEKLDAHRKKVQADHPKAHLTNQYNALNRLREIERGEGEPLSKAERSFHQRALIGILKSLHDDLDRAVADAYGWPHDLENEKILQRLVDLNAERAAEEEQGLIRWLRPEFQNPDGEHSAHQVELDVEATKPKARGTKKKHVWPKESVQQLMAIQALLAGEGGAWTVEDVASSFERAHRKTVQRHLESYARAGLFNVYEDGGVKRWSARLPGV